MIKDNKIILIIPYFGKFPNYFDLFIESCKYNENIDWMIVTDNKYKCKYKNIKIINMTFKDLEGLIKKRLNKEISINKPYKLCDYKPAYGMIFENYIQEYNFWGHCDMDMIFGNISSFINDEILSKYDKLFIHGHLTLYKNTEEMNKAFLLEDKNEITFNEVVKTQETMYFDEIGIVNILNSKGINQYESKCYADILPQYKTFRLANDENYKEQYFYWKQGRVIKKYKSVDKYMKEEYIYIHLQKRKFKEHNIDIKNSKGFYITPHGFIDISNSEYKQYYKGNMKHVLSYHYTRYKGITPTKVKRAINKNLKVRLFKDI